LRRKGLRREELAGGRKKAKLLDPSKSMRGWPWAVISAKQKIGNAMEDLSGGGENCQRDGKGSGATLK